MARSDPGSILVLTAVEREASALARHLELPLLRGLPFTAFGRGRLRLAPVGLAAARLTERWPALVHDLGRPLVVSAGVCGGLDPRMPCGGLVVPDEVIGPAGERLDLAGPGSPAPAVRAATGAHPGPLVTVRQVVATPEDKAALRAATGAAAVDMESAAIVAAARAAGLPALVVRGVLDHAAQAIPPALTRVVTAEGRVRLAGMLTLALTHPAAIAPAIDLGRGARRALRAVARALTLLVSQGSSGF